jgi:outer membrane protein
MLRAFALLCSLTFLSTLPAAAVPKFAAVKVSEIYGNLVSTRTMNDNLDRERKAIIDDERAVHLRKILEEMKQLYAELQKRRSEPVDDVTRKLAQAFEQKRQESQTLQEEFQLFENEKKKEINRKMVAAMRTSLDKIAETTRRIAKEKGYDAAFDVSGNSNSLVPVILYSKVPNDITEEVVAALKDVGEPSTPPATAAPAPPAAPPSTAKP